MIQYFQPALVTLAVLMTASCAHFQTPSAPPLQPGQEAWIHYTCRLPDDQIAATTHQEVVKNQSLKKSNIYRTNASGLEPVKVTATGPAQCPECLTDKNRGFVEHITIRLEREIIGMQAGESREVLIDAELMQGLRKEDRYLRFARRWQLPKTETIARAHFIKAYEQEPVVGDEITWKHYFQAKIADVSETEVTLEILSAESREMESMWGPAVIRDAGEDFFEVQLTELYVGRLVRLGPLVGRVSEVGDKMFTTDFGHPFGGETLRCDIEVASVGSAHPALAAATPASAATVANSQAPGAPVSANPAAAAAPGLAPAQSDVSGASEIAGVVQRGDLVSLHYTARLEDGRLLQTTLEDAAAATDTEGSDVYQPIDRYGPVDILAGSEQGPLPALGAHVIGLKPGQKRTVTVTPTEAFGSRDPNLIKAYPCIKRLPKISRVSAVEYVRQFNGFPKINDEVPLTPYFGARVIAISDNQVTLEAMVETEQRQREDIGETRIRVEGDEVVIRLEPEIGAPFELDGGVGRITAADREFFTVDFNPPLAGEPIVMDIEVVALTKASRFQDVEITWVENHEEGLAIASQIGKPMVLVLYAGWCGWSQKLLDVSFQDPRIKALKDQFVWVKIDSDKNREYHALYDQNGFPLILLLDAEGEIIQRIDGFLPAANLSRELKKTILVAAAG
jgi:FKBP-type peptidyl-prolyl cis-trans isomerase 2